jgi:hypothetical protein
MYRALMSRRSTKSEVITLVVTASTFSIFLMSATTNFIRGEDVVAGLMAFSAIANAVTTVILASGLMRRFN